MPSVTSLPPVVLRYPDDAPPDRTHKNHPHLPRPVKVLLLLSGGIDSPVAGRLLQEGGHEVGAVHFSQAPFTDDSPEEKSRASAELLGMGPVWSSRAGACFATLASDCEHRYYYVLSKRFMLRTAAALARREGYDAVATGENLGQVSSQTLQNLASIHQAAGLPVLTPLLALDKQEIITIAEEIGTYDLSVGPEMCDALGPDKPATWTSLDEVLEQEARIDTDALTEAALDALTGPIAASAE